MFLWSSQLGEAAGTQWTCAGVLGSVCKVWQIAVAEERLTEVALEAEHQQQTRQELLTVAISGCP